MSSSSWSSSVACSNTTHNQSPPRLDKRAVVPLLPGDSLVIEIYLPGDKEQAAEATSNVVLSYAMHSFLDLFETFKESQKVRRGEGKKGHEQGNEKTQSGSVEC